MSAIDARPMLTVINPNTDAAVTGFMAAIVAETVGPGIRVEGRTAENGPGIVTTEQALAAAADEVSRAGMAAAEAGAAALLVAGFGDPGVGALAQRLTIPVTGIAEAAIAAAAAGGRRFSIVTTTPLLVDAIAATVAHYGHANQLAAIRVTPGEAEATMAEPETLADALLALCRDTVATDGAAAVVIGGGPLALAARAIECEIGVPLIEPVRAGARLAAHRLRAAG